MSNNRVYPKNLEIALKLFKTTWKFYRAYGVKSANKNVIKETVINDLRWVRYYKDQIKKLTKGYY
jgi:hypothetical protein